MKTTGEMQALSVLFDQLTDGVCIVDVRGDILYMNPVADRLLRRSGAVLNACGLLCDHLEDAAGRAVGGTCPLRDPENRTAGAVTFSGKHGPLAVFDWRDDRVVRVERWRDLRVRCLRARLPTMAGVEEDVRVVLIEDAAKEGEFARQREDWRQMVAHDMRSPLTGIYAGLKLLEEKHPKPSAGEADEDTKLVETSLSSCRRLMELLDLYLDVVQLDAGAMPVSLSPVALAPVLAEIAEEHAPAARARGIAVELAASADAVALADPDLMTRVVENLLDNAIKYNVDGGKVALSAERRGADVTLSVKDTGRGIDAKDLPLLFDRYYQAQGRREGRTRGNGLGLAFCKQAVERMDGAIEARSPASGGAEFVVTLRAAEVKP
jgi:signal transduction histidine kinase